MPSSDDCNKAGDVEDRGDFEVGHRESLKWARLLERGRETRGSRRLLSESAGRWQPWSAILSGSIEHEAARRAANAQWYEADQQSAATMRSGTKQRKPARKASSDTLIAEIARSASQAGA